MNLPRPSTLLAIIATALIYTTAALTLHPTEVVMSGDDGLSDGEGADDTGAGTLGSYADAAARLAAIRPKPETQQIQKEVVRKSPPPPPAPQAPVYRAPEQTEQPEKVSDEVPQPAPADLPQETLPDAPAEQQASDAMVKGNGSSEQTSSGRRSGSAKSYIRDLYQWLARHRVYPPTAKRNKDQGTVMLAFTMNRQGDVLSSHVKTSSGHTALDNAALQMLIKASPLPAVPDDFHPTRDTLPLVMPIEFSLITNSSFGD